METWRKSSKRLTNSKTPKLQIAKAMNVRQVQRGFAIASRILIASAELAVSTFAYAPAPVAYSEVKKLIVSVRGQPEFGRLSFKRAFGVKEAA